VLFTSSCLTNFPEANTDFPEAFSISSANVGLVMHIPRSAHQRAAGVLKSYLWDANKVWVASCLHMPRREWRRFYLTSQILAQIDMFDFGQILHAPVTALPPVHGRARLAAAPSSAC